MPGRKKKHFRNNFREVAKQGATTYSLIHGPEEDENGPALDVDPSEEPLDDEAKQEQKKYGIFFEDEYNYLQHLKDVSEFQQSRMAAQPVIIKGEEEDAISTEGAEGEFEEFFKLGQAAHIDFSAPQPDWDPDIVEALEKPQKEYTCMGEDVEEDDDEDGLEDNFMDLADPEHEGETNMEQSISNHLHKIVHIGPKKGEEEGSYMDFHSDDAEFDDDDAEFDDDDDEFDDNDDDEWEDEDADAGDEHGEKRHPGGKSHLSNNELLRRLDEQTRVLMSREYGEDQIGALDLEELHGRCGVDSDLMQQVLHNKKEEEKNKTFTLAEFCEGKVKPQIPPKWQYVEEVGEEEAKERDDKSVADLLGLRKKPEWDCETILSTLSTTKNLPKTVPWPQSGEKKQKAKKKPEPRGLTLREIEQMRRAEKTADTPPTFRAKGETPEEKRERKNAIKEHKKARREEKKANKLAFKADLLNAS